MVGKGALIRLSVDSTYFGNKSYLDFVAAGHCSTYII